MDFKGAEVIHARREEVFTFITDPHNFSKGIPDIQRVEILDGGRFKVVAKLGVSAIRAAFDIVFEVTDETPPSHVKLRGHGVGGGSAVDLDISIDLEERGAQTELRWAASAIVSGMLASLGQRVLVTVSDRLVNEIFTHFRMSLEPKSAAD